MNNTKPLRYVALNPNQDQPASYNCGLGATNAYKWACDNARQNKGDVLCEFADGTVQQVKTFKVLPTNETPPKSV
jgi:hypothetical protein